MSDIQPPDLLDREPEQIIHAVLINGWDNSNISGRFELDSSGRPKWLHTGWYDRNGLPQVSVSPRNEGPTGATETGYTGIDASGAGPTSMIDGQVDVNVWVPHDTQPYEVTGENPKKLAGELKRECKRVLASNPLGTTYNGETELKFIGVGEITSPPEPEDTEVENRYHIPALYGYHQGREATDS